jgi:hypothetical protein
VDNQNIEFKLPQDAYVNFDAVSLKEFMIQQLNKTGVFTDQNYEGSNMSSIIEILGYYTHVLLFYLNQTSSESIFSQASIYENMNRIVKLMDYKPTGKQTSLVPIECTASEYLLPGSYIFRKYSYILLDNIQYTFMNDYPFEKISNGSESIKSINDSVVLFQGSISNYPTYIAEGVGFETLPIVVDNLVNDNDTRFISHGSISVYVFEKNNNKWYEYTEIENLFLTSSTERYYELRLNENGNYEVKFGNGMFSRILSPGDEVSVFYIMSDGQKGVVSKNALTNSKIFLYNTQLFNEIYLDVATIDMNGIIKSNVDDTFNEQLVFTNPANSTNIQEAETIDEIRSNAPVFLSSQLRLVTKLDYEKYLKKSIPNILNDVLVVDNNTYMKEYIKYFYDICVDPNKVTRVILNQVNFADSSDFNNVNVFCVPTFKITQDEQYPEFLNNSFKNTIINLTNDKKIISAEVVPRDPIYMALDLGYTTGIITKDIYKDTKLIVVRDNNNKVSKEKIKLQIVDVLINYFTPSNVTLGHKISMDIITGNILGISGIKSIRTMNGQSYIEGLSFIMWTPMFEGVDERLVTQTLSLPFFKFPYLYRPNSLITKIEVIDE